MGQPWARLWLWPASLSSGRRAALVATLSRLRNLKRCGLEALTASPLPQTWELLALWEDSPPPGCHGGWETGTVVQDQSRKHVLALLSPTQELLHRSPLRHPAWADSVQHQPAQRDHLKNVPPPPVLALGWAKQKEKASLPQIQPLPRGSASEVSVGGVQPRCPYTSLPAEVPWGHC